MDLERRRVLAILTGTEQIRDNERQLAEARAAFEGRALGGLDTRQAERRQTLDRQQAVEESALRRRTEAEAGGLREQIPLADGSQRVALENQLTEVLGRAEVERTEIRASFAAKRSQIDTQEFNERVQNIQKELAAEDLALRARKVEGALTVTEEIQVNRTRAQDPRIPFPDRLANAEQGKERAVRLEEDLFAIRRTLGQASLADEVRRQREIVSAHRGGIQERIDGERRLADVQRQFREQTATAGQGALQSAAADLTARQGPGAFTLPSSKPPSASSRRSPCRRCRRSRPAGPSPSPNSTRRSASAPSSESSASSA